MRAAPLVLLAAVLLAGCSLPAGGGGDSTPTTVTPAAVPNETTPLNLGPPVDAGDSLAPVVDAHRDALEGEPFTYRATYRGPFPSDPTDPRNVTVEGFVGRNRTTYYLRADYGDDVYRQWSNGSVFVSLRTTEDTRRGGVGRPALPGDSQAERLAESYLFRAQGTTVTEVVREGERYRISAEVDPDTRASMFDESWVPNASVHLIVGTDRRIRSYRLDYTVVHNGTRVRGVEEYVYETGPGLALPQPAWVDNVLANNTDRQNT